MSLFDRIATVAAQRRDRTAVSSEAGRVTFAELLENAQRFADWLAASDHPPTVMIALPSGAAFTAVQLAGLAAGAVIAPVPDKLTPDEARSYLALVQPDVAVVASAEPAQALLAALPEHTTVVTLDGPPVPGRRCLAWSSVCSPDTRPAPPTSAPHGLPAQTRQIQFTSGSTGAPKGILLDEANLLANLDANTDHLAWFCDRDVFCPIPQFHAMGNAVVLEHLSHGSPIHTANRFLPGEDLARMVEFGCAGLLASPNYYKLMIKLRVLRANAVPDLASMTIGTASVDPALVDELRDAFPQARLHIRYGLSEAVGALTRLDLEPGERLTAAGLIGAPVAGAELAEDLPPLDQGEPAELRVRHGSNAIGQLTERGAWSPLASDDGFLATGDLAYRDREGRLYLRGRLSAFVKYNGYRVNAFEIEGVLRAVDGVQEAVVVGVPDDLTGERIVACLEASPGAALPDRETLLAACQERLSVYKIPQEFRPMDALPRTPAGKPDRARIRAACS